MIDSKPSSVHSPIPNWEQLCFYKSASHLSLEEKDQIEKLKHAPPGLLFTTLRYLIMILSKEYTINKFVNFSWGELVDIIHDQASRNQQINLQATNKNTHLKETLNPYINRNHNQLPCTAQTTINRVIEAKKMCSYNDPILLVGDDDIVGLELVKAGFTDVTSIDIDPIICQYLKKQASDLNLPLKVFQHDLSDKPKPEMIKEYKLVFLDPMYSLDGIKLFIKGAFALNSLQSGTQYFLSLHLMSLLRQGVHQLSDVFDGLGLSVCDFKGGFNTYPIPSKLKYLIKLFNRRFMKTNIMSSENYIFQFFLSDAILLEKKD